MIPATMGKNASICAQIKARVEIIFARVIGVILENFVKVSVVNMESALTGRVYARNIGKVHIVNEGDAQEHQHAQEMVYVTVHCKNVIVIQDGKVLTVVNWTVLANLTVTHVGYVFHIPRVLNA